MITPCTRPETTEHHAAAETKTETRPETRSTPRLRTRVRAGARPLTGINR